MSTTIIIGVVAVNLALVCYAAAFVSGQRARVATRMLLLFLSFGVVFDLLSTVLMTAASNGPSFSLHGVLGWVSLACMLVYWTLILRHSLRHGYSALVAKGVYIYGRLSFVLWIVAFVAGVILAAGR